MIGILRGTVPNANTQATIRDAKFHEVEQFVRRQAGRRLPGERELAAQFGISRPRVRALLQVLEREGLVQRRQGSGTYALLPSDDELRRVVLLADRALKFGDDPFFSRLMELLQVELQNSGTQCFVQRTVGSADSVMLMPRHDGLLALGVAALEALCAPTRVAQPALVAQPAVALFAATTTKPGPRLSLLELDDEAAGAAAAQRLVESGVHRVYFFGRNAIPAVRERLSGVRRELQEAGVELEVVECGLNYTAGLEMGLHLAVPGTAPCGLIAANDWLAVGLHTGVQSQSPQLRRRLTIVSFDGLAFARRPELGIASLGVPLEAMATDAVAELRRLKHAGVVGRAIRYSLEWSDLKTIAATIEEKTQ